MPVFMGRKVRLVLEKDKLFDTGWRLGFADLSACDPIAPIAVLLRLFDFGAQVVDAQPQFISQGLVHFNVFLKSPGAVTFLSAHSWGNYSI